MTTEHESESGANEAPVATEQVRGTDLGQRLRELVDEGKAHRIVVRRRDGRKLFELSALAGGVITLAAPQIAALVAFGAILDYITLELYPVGDPEA